MRHWIAAIVAILLQTGAFAQQSGPRKSGANMPGQIVSNGYSLSSPGRRIPSVVLQAGKKIGSPLVKPYDPSRPLDVFNGTNLSPSSVVAPVSGFPGLGPQPDLLDRINAKLDSVTVSSSHQRRH